MSTLPEREGIVPVPLLRRPPIADVTSPPAVSAHNPGSRSAFPEGDHPTPPQDGALAPNLAEETDPPCPPSPGELAPTVQVPVITCEATRFALSLTTMDEVSWNEGEHEICKLGVVAFDSVALQDKCSVESVNYDDALADFDAIYQAVFSVEDIWSSRDLLHAALCSLGKLHGWNPRKDGRRICCNRFPKKRNNQSGRPRALAAGHLEDGNCEFFVMITPFDTHRTLSKAGKFQYHPCWDKPCIISDVSLLHCGNCVPSRGNLVAVTKASGTYVRNIPQRALFTLCSQHEMGSKLTFSVVYAAVRPVWPKQKSVTGKDVANMRLKVMRSLPAFRTCKDFQDFQRTVNDSTLLGGLDDQVMMTDDEAYALAHSACAEVLQEDGASEDSVFSILQFLELIRSRAKGFVYEKISSKGTGKKKLLGLLWMTATM